MDFIAYIEADSSCFSLNNFPVRCTSAFAVRDVWFASAVDDVSLSRSKADLDNGSSGSV